MVLKSKEEITFQRTRIPKYVLIPFATFTDEKEGGNQIKGATMGPSSLCMLSLY